MVESIFWFSWYCSARTALASLLVVGRIVTIRADQVAGPTMPSEVRPRLLWKERTLESVPEPKSPSTPVATPCAFSRYCNAVTSAPSSPRSRTWTPWLFTPVACAAGVVTAMGAVTARTAVRSAAPSLVARDCMVELLGVVPRGPDAARSRPPP